MHNPTSLSILRPAVTYLIENGQCLLWKWNKHSKILIAMDFRWREYKVTRAISLSSPTARSTFKWMHLSLYCLIQMRMLFAGVWQCTDVSSSQPVFDGAEPVPGWRHHERQSWAVWSQVWLSSLVLSFPFFFPKLMDPFQRTSPNSADKLYHLGNLSYLPGL